MGSRRDEWAERVRQWRRSGLTAGEFAGSIGMKPSTLRYWAWRLGREERVGHEQPRRRRRAEAEPVTAPSRFVEVIAGPVESERFELELPNGWRLRIPAAFDAEALGRLLQTCAGAGR